ncbi:MAG: ATP-binding protein [Rickettsiales bacterium]
MEKQKFFRKLSHPYVTPFLIIFITISLLFIYFVIEEYRHTRDRITKVLTSESEKIEKTLTNVMDHTSFMMSNIAMQIKSNHQDKKYIYSVINKYIVDPKLYNILSWTVFTWADKNHVTLVDSVSGVKTKQKNISNRYHIQKTKIFPNKLHLGKPNFGFTSQRYVIPAALGVYNEDSYIGALTIGFDLVQLSTVLADAVKDQNIYYALLDSNFDTITQSPSNIKSDKTSVKSNDIKGFIKEKGVLFESLLSVSQINLMKSGTNHYLHKFRDYPYAVYLRYDDKVVRNLFWKDITFRVVEILVIGLIAFIIVILIYNREKTLREKAELAKKEAEDASQAKTNFLAYTAHELRSPLSYIISSSEIMMKNVFGKVPKKYQLYINNINYSSRELLEFIEDLLNEMRVKRGSFDVKLSFIDVKEILLRSLKINSLNYNNKIKYEIKGFDELPKLNSDPKRLIQVFNNIISNAIKYSPEGSVLKIIAKLKLSGLKIYFVDSGYGMSEDEVRLSKIKFGITGNNKKEVSGSAVGLGLPLVVELIAILKGEFNIKSKAGSGTEVSIFFPKKLLKK